MLAGMTCAHHLGEHPEKFDVTLIDAVDYCGGQAYSIPIDKEKYGASWLNQGVQVIRSMTKAYLRLILITGRIVHFPPYNDHVC